MSRHIGLKCCYLNVEETCWILYSNQYLIFRLNAEFTTIILWLGLNSVFVECTFPYIVDANKSEAFWSTCIALCNLSAFFCFVGKIEKKTNFVDIFEIDCSEICFVSSIAWKTEKSDNFYRLNLEKRKAFFKP